MKALEPYLDTCSIDRCLMSRSSAEHIRNQTTNVDWLGLQVKLCVAVLLSLYKALGSVFSKGGKIKTKQQRI